MLKFLCGKGRVGGVLKRLTTEELEMLYYEGSNVDVFDKVKMKDGGGRGGGGGINFKLS